MSGTAHYLPSLLAMSQDSWRALSIALAGLSIVFLALVLISLFIAVLPRVLKWVDVVWPESEDRHTAQPQPPGVVSDEAALFAAIGFVLHTELQRQLADERRGEASND